MYAYMAGLLHERPGKVLTGPSQKKKHKINLANKNHMRTNQDIQ